MFTIFKGYHLVEEYHQWKKQQRNGQEHKLLIKSIKLAIILVACAVLWALPTSAFGIPGLTLVEHRTIVVFVFASLMWVLEPIPAWATSVTTILLLLLTCSDSGLKFLFDPFTAEQIGKTIKYQSILASFADPIVMLFLGGFVLAIAASKSGIDSVLAKKLLKPFGTRSEIVLLGFLLVTALFSMFVSNTATAAMMLTFLAPVLKALPADGKGKIALALSIPIAANVGGIGTPIGTPPNAIVLKYLNDPTGLNLNIGFAEWMLIMVPFMLVILIISWLLLLKMFPFKQKKIVLEIEGEAQKGWQTTVIYITFALTILMWCLDKFTGVNANVVALIPVTIFAFTGILTKRDLEQINWSVLWMVAGGFAIGTALNQTGLAQHFIDAIPFDKWPALLVILGAGILCIILSTFISNTATAALLAPILAVVGTSMHDILTPYGGVRSLLIGVAICASLAMALPISTPPNALAYATGMIQQKDMAKTGIIVGIIGVVIGYFMLIVLGV